jgi:hypothetical protein
MLAPSQLSQLVVNRAKRTVPYPLLGENTLVLSDLLCLGPNDKGQPCLMCRSAGSRQPRRGRGRGGVHHCCACGGTCGGAC